MGDHVRLWWIGAVPALMNNSNCVAWNKKNVLTANKQIYKCQVIGIIELKVDDLNPVKVLVLVVKSKLMGFDIIKKFDNHEVQ